MTEPWRCFLAISPDAQLLNAILALMQSLVSELPTGWRWTAGNNLHLTLRFLGETDPQQIPNLDRALKSAVGPLPAMRLRFNRLGGFPRPARPSLLWLGLEQDETLLQLGRTIEDVVTTFGFRRELKAFHPHLTLARLASQSDLTAMHRAASLLSAAPQVDLPAWETDEIVLMRSQLQPRGPVYRVVARVKLHEFKLM